MWMSLIMGFWKIFVIKLVYQIQITGYHIGLIFFIKLNSLKHKIDTKFIVVYTTLIFQINKFNNSYISLRD